MSTSGENFLSKMAWYHCHHCWLFFCYISLFPPRGLVWSFIGITDYIRNTLLGDHIIAIYWFWFSPSRMVSYHCHHYWLLFFVVFRHFFPTDDCDHLLGSLITFEVLCWAIVSELFIMFVFLPERWCCITVTVDDCCCLSFVFVSSQVWIWPLVFGFFPSLWMSATTHYDHLWHLKYFADWYY